MFTCLKYVPVAHRETVLDLHSHPRFTGGVYTRMVKIPGTAQHLMNNYGAKPKDSKLFPGPETRVPYRTLY